MKLWQKISLLTAAILLISMVVYGGITVYETSNYNIRQTSSAASRQVRATAYALGQSLENAATEEMSDTARKAYLQFLLAQIQQQRLHAASGLAACSEYHEFRADRKPANSLIPMSRWQLFSRKTADI